MRSVPLPALLETETADEAQAFRAIVDREFDFVWRSLRRLGVLPEAVDDASQQVWIVAAKKHASTPLSPGSSRPFLFAIALRVASDARRSARRRRETPDDGAIEAASDPAIGADVALEKANDRAALDLALDTLSPDLRAVFVLYELEELSMKEIAELLQLPSGTVASRLRRAREAFQLALRKWSARQ